MKNSKVPNNSRVNIWTHLPPYITNAFFGIFSKNTNKTERPSAHD